MAETPDPALPHELQEKAREVLELACERDWYLTTAESCTGGLLAALLTDIPGCSHIFERGFVAYSDAAKCDMLGLAKSTVDDCGAVSKPVAEAMAKGALSLSHAQLSVSITGFAGPPGKGDEGEEGLVHFASAVRDGEVRWREEHFGAIGRDGVREKSLGTALDMMREALEE